MKALEHPLGLLITFNVKLLRTGVRTCRAQPLLKSQILAPVAALGAVAVENCLLSLLG
jgi:hypothetical protein